VVATLQKYDLKLGLENHPEKTPQEMLAKIGDGGAGRIGTAVDTGWYGTQGYDAAQAIERLGRHIVHVHLKDVLAPGGHQTCRFGQGCVPLEACVRALEKIGYSGNYSVEHEPETSDPTEDCQASLAMLQNWLHS
jgi:sugar phosphate isomerase/epimerase